jgi:hypothetical protein
VSSVVVVKRSLMYTEADLGLEVTESNPVEVRVGP